MLEAAVQAHTRLELARAGAIVQRNNVGACEDQTGRIIRYGLMNESRQQNQQFKSSDLINVVPLVIRPDHVGRTLGIYTAFECKASGWKLQPGDQRAQAQLRYLQLIQSVGGVAGFITDPSQVAVILDSL